MYAKINAQDAKTRHFRKYDYAPLTWHDDSAGRDDVIGDVGEQHGKLDTAQARQRVDLHQRSVGTLPVQRFQLYNDTNHAPFTSTL